MKLQEGHLKQNIRSYLAIMIVLLGFGILYSSMFKEVKSNETITNQVVTGVQTIMVFVLGYFFGAAKPQTDTGTTTTEVTLKKTEPKKEESTE